MTTDSEEMKKHTIVWESHIRDVHNRFVAGFPLTNDIKRAACVMLAERLIEAAATLARFGVDPALIGDYAAAIARGTLAREALENKGAPASGETGA